MESGNILDILALYVISYIPKEAPMINVFVDVFILCDREKFGDIPPSRSARCDQVFDVYNAKLLILAVLLCCIYQSVTLMDLHCTTEHSQHKLLVDFVV